MSVIKVRLLVTLFRAVDAGQADLDQRITLQSHHKRSGTGVLQTLDAGLVLRLRDAGTLMIIQSDNTHLRTMATQEIEAFVLTCNTHMAHPFEWNKGVRFDQRLKDKLAARPELQLAA